MGGRYYVKSAGPHESGEQGLARGTYYEIVTKTSQARINKGPQIPNLGAKDGRVSNPR